MSRGRALIEATPPARSLASAGPCVGHPACGSCSCSCRIRSVALKELPIKAVSAFVVRYTLRHVWVLFNYIVNHVVDFVVANADAPTGVSYCIVDTLKASVTL